MNIRLPFHLIALLSLLVSACGQGSTDTGKDPGAKKHDSLLTVIDSNERSIRKNMRTAVLDPSLAARSVMAYSQFAQSYPSDSNAPMFLFKAADISGSSMKQYDQSASMLEKIIRDYPSFRKLPACYFQLGLIYDDYLNDDAKAKQYYEQFIAKYPSSPMVPQVQALISYLGKTNDELIKDFEKKNK